MVVLLLLFFVVSFVAVSLSISFALWKVSNTLALMIQFVPGGLCIFDFAIKYAHLSPKRKLPATKGPTLPSNTFPHWTQTGQLPLPPPGSGLQHLSHAPLSAYSLPTISLGIIHNPYSFSLF